MLDKDLTTGGGEVRLSRREGKHHENEKANLPSEDPARPSASYRSAGRFGGCGLSAIPSGVGNGPRTTGRATEQREGYQMAIRHNGALVAENVRQFDVIPAILGLPQSGLFQVEILPLVVVATYRKENGELTREG